MGLRWWDAKRPAFTARSRSSSEGAFDSATVLVEVGRAASDEDVASAAGTSANAGSRVDLWQSEQITAAPRPSLQTSPALGLADAADAIRADLEPALRRGPQPDAPHQQRRGDRRGRVEEAGRDASRRHGADGPALDAAVAPQQYCSAHRFCADLRWTPDTPLAEPMPVKPKTVVTVGRPTAARAVARPSCLDVGLDFRPRLDVEGGVDQGQNCFGHSMAGRSNRNGHDLEEPRLNLPASTLRVRSVTPPGPVPILLRNVPPGIDNPQHVPFDVQYRSGLGRSLLRLKVHPAVTRLQQERSPQVVKVGGARRVRVHRRALRCASGPSSPPIRAAYHSDSSTASPGS